MPRANCKVRFALQDTSLLTQSYLARMTLSEKFCLKWNDFQKYLATSFGEMREDPDFSDVTLVCEDGEQIAAHRVLLSACSPFFNSVLKRNKHSHPLIYMRGLKSKDLTSIVDFMYHGEANISQENLDSFLSLAEELQLKGLTGSNGKTENENMDTPNSFNEFGNHLDQKPATSESSKKTINRKREHKNHTELKYEDIELNHTKNHPIVPADCGKIIVASDINSEELDAKIDSMIENITGGYKRFKCTVCGKADKQRVFMKRHVETHLTGVSHSCDICGKVARSSNALIMHHSNYHRIK